MNYYLKALISYNLAINMNPSDSEYYVNKGQMLEKILEYQQAISCYDSVIKLNPNDSDFYNFKGRNALDSLKQYQEAISCFDQAINLNPNGSDYYNNKGNSLAQISKYQEAISCFDLERCFNILLQQSQIIFSFLSRQSIINQQALINQQQKAMSNFDQAINLSPREFQFYEIKGKLFMNIYHLYKEATICFKLSQGQPLAPVMDQI